MIWADKLALAALGVMLALVGLAWYAHRRAR
jgi:hypothetical protein